MINMDFGDSLNLLHKHIIYQKKNPSLTSRNTLFVKHKLFAHSIIQISTLDMFQGVYIL